MSQSVFKSIKDHNSELFNQNVLTEDGKVIDREFGHSIYNLFDHLYLLFQNLDLLYESEKDLVDKFKFIHAYPDEAKTDQASVVTYHIVSRAPALIKSSIINGGSTTRYKPSVVGEQYNSVTGNVDELYKLQFENIVSITIFASKARVLNNLAKVMESVLLKYSSSIKKCVDEYIYLGMSDIRFLDGYEGKTPIYSRELQYKVFTTEGYKQELEQAKSITIQT